MPSPYTTPLKVRKRKRWTLETVGEIPSTEEESLDDMLEDLEVDDEVLELNDLEFEPGGSWAAAAGKFVQLTCLHYTALKEIGQKALHPNRGDQRLSAFINKAELKTIAVVPEFRDQKMQSINEFLKSFEPDEQKRNNITIWLKGYSKIPKSMVDRCGEATEEGNLDKQAFHGTWHCETLLLGLYALTVRSELRLI